MITGFQKDTLRSMKPQNDLAQMDCGGFYTLAKYKLLDWMTMANFTRFRNRNGAGSTQTLPSTADKIGTALTLIQFRHCGSR